ncbi:MAG: MTH895/ArsE family thioredoxin-like protein [Spirochaetaceae bacterium]
MTIQILGPGCPNCQNLEKNAREAVNRLGMEAEFEKVTDVNQIVEMGVMRTPGFAIDGEVQKFGKVFSSEEIEEILEQYGEQQSDEHHGNG